MKKISGKFIFIIFCIVLVVLLFVFLFCVPDLIIIFHNFLYDRLGLKSNSQLNPNSYIQMVISIFSCCVTAVLGCSTFYLTRILRTIETERHNAKLATAAYQLQKNIKHNCWVIFNANKNLNSLDELQFFSKLDETWFVLSAAGELDNNELHFLIKYNKKIQEIEKFFKEGNETIDLERNFCNSFLFGENEFDYNEEFKKLISKLEEIMNRRVFEWANDRMSAIYITVKKIYKN